MSAEVVTEAHKGPLEVDVSIILPVFNELGHLEKEIFRIREAMETSSYSFELIVVDDGSTDGSSELLADIDGIRLLQFNTNRGSGSARKYGTLAARGRVVIWTDVDMIYPNDEMPELVDQLNGWDQVVGARRTEEGTVKFLRKPAKWFIRHLDLLDRNGRVGTNTVVILGAAVSLAMLADLLVHVNKRRHDVIPATDDIG